jgi:GNAT superfamily N-acetyltransferase
LHHKADPAQHDPTFTRKGPMLIRSLSHQADRAHVTDLFARAADYVLLESGLPPAPDAADDFFTEAPPGKTAADCRQFGIFHGNRLDAMATVLFGYPEPADAYIGLLIVDAAQRRRGLGRSLAQHVFAASRDLGARRMLIAVLDANPKGRAFWASLGFVHQQTFPADPDAMVPHIRHRMTRAL